MTEGPARTPERREYQEGWRPKEFWIVDEIEVWRVWCMDCGFRIGTVNAGNSSDAVRLTSDHNRTLHRR